ncbi:MAG: type IV secretory system conjugative DNA transfer family protein [Candidatus Paceibacterota bacterium]|jgi:hypothetical protein
MIPNLVLTLVIILVALALAGLVYWYWRRHRKWDSLNLKILSIKIPRANDQEKVDFLKEINLTEQLFNSLSALKQPFVFELSVKNVGEEIGFFLSVPRSVADFAKREIQGFFLDAKVEEVSDYTIFQPQGTAVAGYLSLDKEYFLPIGTYQEVQVDIFAPILSTLSRINERDEGVSIQLVLRPAPEKTKKTLVWAAEKLKRGVKFSEVSSIDRIGLKDFEREWNGKPKPKEADAGLPPKIDEEMVKAVGLKLAKPLFEVNVRLVTSAIDPNRAEDMFVALSSAFAKLASPIRNGFKIIKPKKIRPLIFDYVFRDFNKAQMMILNTEELASIFHLPTHTSDVPNVSWLRSKEAPPPEVVPKEGLKLGDSVFRGTTKEVRITDEDRRRHLYIIGQTGTGKSVLIQNLAMQDMVENKGICVIDPHGETIEKILAYVPKDRIDDIIIFDPGDRQRPLGLNMLEYDPNKPEEKTFIVNELISIFNQLFDKQALGPMFERYMRSALYLLMDDMVNEPATLMEIPRVFTDEEFRKRKLARSTNPQVIDFWTKEVTKTSGDQSLGNFAPYVSSKFDNFISNSYLRPIIGQAKSAFDFRRAMDEGKIILVNLSKGKVGDLSSSLLGMVIVGKILKAALSRVDIADERARRDFYLYIDEFQNYTTDSIATILSEARKYRLNLVVAHQFIAQLKDNIREAVFGNVGNMVSFRVGPSDAETLVKHFGPVFNEKDLISIENLNAFAKILVNGEPSKPFNMKITWPTGGSAVVRDGLKELSRLRFGQDLNEIEEDILKRLRG